jgi:SAM-dependent methyltransferase
MEEDKVKGAVRDAYAKVAKNKPRGFAVNSCCGGSSNFVSDISLAVGYKKEELDSVPEGANLGLGCGNPTALASLKKGETVLDLGAGAGFDCFLAANIVGVDGQVIGVDMTPEMVDKARSNARKGGYKNVDFRLGELEHLPVADNSVDVLISNCVINLTPDKAAVFNEAFRVLKPGGRFAVSDIVLLKELPDAVKQSVAAYVGCLSGAIMKDDYLETIRAAGFEGVEIVDETALASGFEGVEIVDGSALSLDCFANDPTVQTARNNLNLTPEELENVASAVVSIIVVGEKP